MDHTTVLALRAKAGDRRALNEFVHITGPDVHQLCRYLGFPADADDLMQETFERALKALHRYRGDGPARSWVLSIARRVCVDATRRAVRGRRLRERVEAHAAVDPHWDRSWYEVLELLAELAPERREAFVLTGMDAGSGAMTMQQVGEITLAPGETVALEPGGLHIMLLDLAAPLELGEEFDLTLQFENGGDQVVSVEVRDEAP